LAVAIQSDNKIVAGGYSTDSSDGSDFVVTRYNTDGSLDASFGSNGKAVTDIGSSDTAYALTIQARRKNTSWRATNGAFAPARIIQTVRDASFRSGGKVVTPMGNGGVIMR
jgi:uncharacterized delta-60 repeat protein